MMYSCLLIVSFTALHFSILLDFKSSIYLWYLIFKQFAVNNSCDYEPGPIVYLTVSYPNKRKDNSENIAYSLMLQIKYFV